MSGTLHPDVVRAINQVAGTPLGRKYDRAMRAKYGKSGVAIAAKTIIGESGGNRNAVSSAGARDLTQFMPGTRADYMKKYGVDAWGTDAEAIKAMMYHHLNTGIKGYNPGMPSYEQYILNQRLDPALNRQLDRGGGAGGASRPGVAAMGESVTIPGASYEQYRSEARRGLLLGGDFSLRNLLEYKKNLAAIPKDQPDETFNLPGEKQPTSRSGVQLDGRPAGKAGFNITGPNPDRLQPELVSFARKVSRIYGKPITGSDGSGHSQYTVNGRVSEHSTGNATDIPAAGKELLRMGRAALVAAGMPRSQAARAKGGLYNVGNHQIIFLTNEGGNHFDHLHISARKGARRA